ncbi:DUF945 family protein [Duganella sp. BuS-21]|uniref:DUF945 family protein n=1 Tax=Duganella sp. BuS-21 TaxID=2943848 RepID=UPI0035A6FA29
MKKTLLAITAASALLAASVHANEKPASAPKRNPLPEFITDENSATLDQAAKELRAAQGDERNVARQLANYARFEFSPELRPKLKAIFGSERPLPMQRAPDSKGQINYVATLAPYLWVQGNGTDFSWSELSAKVSTDKAGRSMNVDASWPSLVIARQEGSMGVRDMRMTSRLQYGADGMGYGTTTFGIASITVREVAVGGREAAELMRFEDMQARSQSVRRGAMVDIGYRSSIKAIVFGAERVERTSFAFRLTNIPVKAMAELEKDMRDQKIGQLAPEAQVQLTLRKVTDFGKRVAKAGATLYIDDLSAAYRGNTASLKGSLTFHKVVDADFDNVTALMKKLVARFSLRLPVALVRDVGRALAAKSVNPDAPDAARQIDAGADGLVSMVVGKAVSGGYAVVEKDELRSMIEFRNGRLTVNGQVLDLQKVNFGGKPSEQGKE